MATKFPPEQDMENISPKDLEEAKKYTKERQAYKDASRIGDIKPLIMKMRTEKADNKASAVDRASRINQMGDTYKSGGMTASKRADGIAVKGKTRGKMC